VNCVAHAEAAKLELGKKVFTEIAEPGCPVCHALADAEARGNVGPNLDILQPDEETVEVAVSQGIGAMPPFENLTDEQIKAVAAYVSAIAGKAE
jgi:mono/diheme cytochrome c family protein